MKIIPKNMIQTWLKQSTNKISIQFFRYIFVGGTAFLVDFGSLYLLTEYFGIFYLMSAAIAFTLGLIANYLLSVRWVFNKHTLDNRLHEVGIFTLVGIVGLGLNEVIIWFFTSNMHLFYIYSKIISAALVLFWNFFARRYTIFR
ncbi:MAG: GtrA family protein [Methanobacterium sp. ERen5]|nr:MAG: GtrA family protein [Methanobacterium sp. ERen5]